MMHKPVGSFAEHGLKPLEKYLTDDAVNEVVINPDSAVFVEYASESHMQLIDDVKMTPGQIQTLGNNLAGETSNAVGKENPIVSGRVKIFGSDMRIQVVIPPAVEDGVSLAIRKFINRVLPVSAIEFVEGHQVHVDEERIELQKDLLDLAEKGEIETLLHKAVDQRLNILISGGTSSGKTTMARAILSITDQQERIVTIEDAIELRPTHPNHVSLVADRRRDSNRTAGKLLESSLRMRPDRLILGEIRGPEALNYLEAINTGHPGSISTIHADSPTLALERLALMVMQSGIRQTRQDVIEYARMTIDMIIQVGRRNGRRGVLEINLPSLQGSLTAGGGIVR